MSRERRRKDLMPAPNAINDLEAARVHDIFTPVQTQVTRLHRSLVYEDRRRDGSESGDHFAIFNSMIRDTAHDVILDLGPVRRDVEGYRAQPGQRRYDVEEYRFNRFPVDIEGFSEAMGLPEDRPVDGFYIGYFVYRPLKERSSSKNPWKKRSEAVDLKEDAVIVPYVALKDDYLEAVRPGGGGIGSIALDTQRNLLRTQFGDRSPDVSPLINEAFHRYFEQCRDLSFDHLDARGNQSTTRFDDMYKSVYRELHSRTTAKASSGDKGAKRALRKSVNRVETTMAESHNKLPFMTLNKGAKNEFRVYLGSDGGFYRRIDDKSNFAERMFWRKKGTDSVRIAKMRQHHDRNLKAGDKTYYSVLSWNEILEYGVLQHMVKNYHNLEPVKNFMRSRGHVFPSDIQAPREVPPPQLPPRAPRQVNPEPAPHVPARNAGLDFSELRIVTQISRRDPNIRTFNITVENIRYPSFASNIGLNVGDKIVLKSSNPHIVSMDHDTAAQFMKQCVTNRDFRPYITRGGRIGFGNPQEEASPVFDSSVLRGMRDDGRYGSISLEGQRYPGFFNLADFERQPPIHDRPDFTDHLSQPAQPVDVPSGFAVSTPRRHGHRDQSMPPIPGAVYDPDTDNLRGDGQERGFDFSNVLAPPSSSTRASAHNVLGSGHRSNGVPGSRRHRLA